MSEHPNDAMTFASYPDQTVRETYPPLPRRLGNPNAVASDVMVANVLSRLPTPLPEPPPAPVPQLPASPDTDPYLAAGWL